MRVQIKDEIGKKALTAAIRSMKRNQLEVGWFQGEKYPNGTSVAKVASIQEFGTGHIPARPFLRPTVQENKQEWEKLMQYIFKGVLSGKTTYRNLLKITGSKVRGDIAKKIESIQSPPLKPSTIAARASKRGLSKGNNRVNTQSLSKPLIDTGLMISTLTYEVSQKKK